MLRPLKKLACARVYEPAHGEALAFLYSVAQTLNRKGTYGGPSDSQTTQAFLTQAAPIPVARHIIERARRHPFWGNRCEVEWSCVEIR